ncbi:hypothetical protein MMC18_009555 [Xylographa bjoerkii]|nr:hypothetical protein [Xylographa bjoerkii]
MGMNKMLALGETHEAGGRTTFKPERIRLILKWPVPQNATDVRSFFGTVQTTRKWVKGYADLSRLLQPPDR